MSHPANTKSSAGIQFADLINRQYLRDPLRLMQILIVSGVLLLSVFVGLLLPEKGMIEDIDQLGLYEVQAECDFINPARHFATEIIELQAYRKLKV